MCEENYGPLLGHCAHLAKEWMRIRMEDYGMTPSQTYVLLYLADHGITAQSVVAAGMKVKAPTANGIIDRMAEKGLLVRSVDPMDARRRLICLTERGAGLVEQIRTQFRRAEAAIVQGFDEEEQQLLRSLLLRIIDNLEKQEEQVC